MAKLAEKAPDGAQGIQQATAMLKKLDGFSAAVTIQKDIDFELGVNMKDADTANQTAMFGNLGLAGVKQKIQDAAKDNEKLLPAVDVLKTIRITAKGSNLMVRGQISFETLEKILQSLPIPGN